MGGESFAQLVRDRIGLPLQAGRIRNGKALVSEQEPDEARYHDDALRLLPSVMSDEQPPVPAQYGAFNIPAWDAPGGLSVAAVDFARVLASLNLRKNNPVINRDLIDLMLRDFIGWDFPHGNGTPAGKYHRLKGGLLDGLQSTVNFTQGGFAYVVYWAKDDVRGVWYPEFPALQGAINKVLDPKSRDRFPDFGMPSF
jgi:CubicO group peptidase (beta-lactamase class C family)